MCCAHVVALDFSDLSDIQRESTFVFQREHDEIRKMAGTAKPVIEEPPQTHKGQRMQEGVVSPCQNAQN
jgi:hypothetical protein